MPILRGVLLPILHLILEVISVLVLILWCFVGDRQCMICGGECCPLVNRVVGALLEDGDLNPNGVFHSLFCVILTTIYRIRGRAL